MSAREDDAGIPARYGPLAGGVALAFTILLSPRILVPPDLDRQLATPGQEVAIFRETRVASVDGPETLTVLARGHDNRLLRIRWPGHGARPGDPIGLRGRVEADGTLTVIVARTHRRRWFKVLVSIPGALLVALWMIRDYRWTLDGLVPRRSPVPGEAPSCPT